MDIAINPFQEASITDSTQSTTTDTTSKQHRWERDEASPLLQQIRFDLKDGKSLNQSAFKNVVHRIAAQSWFRERDRLEQHCGLDTAVVHFFRITPRARVPS